ncbi:MAG: PspC domain-containing protein, partial [Prevotellaceae bacterium]|nr:PspC domain-containing protein [Prevotellaceae bacterium]
MKRVETISINGIVFSIDDDAYSSLNDYLDSLYKYFEHEQGGNEIIADIEARIAELFAERAGGVAQVITNADVLNAIRTLGTPEDIADSESGGENTHFHGNRKKSAGRLYRNPDRRILGGVCAGVAAWLEINVILVRLLFFIAFWFYGISILVYIVLWIIIPAARTTAQKLEMQGQPVNIGNIERSIRENMSSPDSRRSPDRFAGETDGTTSYPLQIIWKVIRVIVGIFLCLTGTGIGLSCFGLFLFHDLTYVFTNEMEWNISPFNVFLAHVFSPASRMMLTVCTILFIAMTVGACLFWGIKIIAGTKVKHVALHVVLLIIWILIIPVTMMTPVRDAIGFFHYNRVNKWMHLNTADTIYLNLKPSAPGIPEISDNPFEIYRDMANSRFYGKPSVYIRKSDDRSAKLKIVKKWRGRSGHMNLRYAENIDYDMNIKDSMITLAAYFTVEPLHEWKNQQLDIFLYV